MFTRTWIRRLRSPYTKQGSPGTTRDKFTFFSFARGRRNQFGDVLIVLHHQDGLLKVMSFILSGYESPIRQLYNVCTAVSLFVSGKRVFPRTGRILLVDCRKRIIMGGKL